MKTETKAANPEAVKAATGGQQTAVAMTQSGLRTNPGNPMFTPVVEGVILLAEATLFAYHAYESWLVPLEGALAKGVLPAGGRFTLEQLLEARANLDKAIAHK